MRRCCPSCSATTGSGVVLAVSPAGLVEINPDGPQWDSVFGKQAAVEQNVMFAPDVVKLDLSKRDFISLRELRATDSGRLVGPKAASWAS